MRPAEVRYRVVNALLQADGPQGLAAVCERAGVRRRAVRAMLDELVAEGSVATGSLVPGRGGAQFVWAARWEARAEQRVEDAVEAARQAVAAVAPVPPPEVHVWTEPSTAFHEFIVESYTPPADKHLLVFFQCSVRRPFSKSPSQGSMRRAVRVATGLDPARDFERCPVHVVVLASRVGPVPYELEGVYPATAGGTGVVQFGPELYERVRPILARRMADYLEVHGPHYAHAATFTAGRYGEVMADAAELAGRRVAVLPEQDGARVVTMGGSRARTYWAKGWVQLYREIVRWLPEAEQHAAEERYRALDVVCTDDA